MIKRNTGFKNLTAGYLFPEVARRRREYQEKNKDAKIISLSIGNTTEPLPKFIAKAMADYSMSLSTLEGYSGYGDEQGNSEFRRDFDQPCKCKDGGKSLLHHYFAAFERGECQGGCRKQSGELIHVGL